MESSEPIPISESDTTPELGFHSSPSLDHDRDPPPPPPSDPDASTLDNNILLPEHSLQNLDLNNTNHDSQNLDLKENHDAQNLHLEEETHEAQTQSFDVMEITHEALILDAEVTENVDLKETHHEDGEESDEEENGEKNKNENESESEDDKVDEDGEVLNNEEGERSYKGHPFPLRPDAEDCAYYMKTGTCKFGFNCKYNHPLRKKNSQGPKEKVTERGEELAERPGQTECKYYLRTGGCKFGKACRYHHPRGKISVAPVLELNFLGLPIRMGEKECPYYMRTGSCKYGVNCRYNHPDPTTAVGSDPSGFGNGGSVSLKIATPSTIASWASPQKMNETPPFVPLMFQPAQGVPSQTPEWNGYQAPVYPPPERSMHPHPAYVMSPATETNVYTHHHQLQQMLLDEYPERPGQPECSYYLKTGDCKFKSNCKYHHPKTQTPRSPPCPLSDKGLPLRPDQNICTHYSRYGICKFGPACKFDHPVHHASTMAGFGQPLPMGTP